MNDNHARLCSSPEWAELIQTELLPSLVGDVELGNEMLEVGPGPGAATEWLRHKVTRLVALEIDENAAALLATRHRDQNVEVVVGDARALEFPSASFDSVASFTMLHHIPTVSGQARVLAEMFRVLRPSGVLLMSDSLASDELHEFHAGDTYNPLDPGALLVMLRALGFDKIGLSSDRVLSVVAAKPAAPAEDARNCADYQATSSMTQRRGPVAADSWKLRVGITGLIAFAGVEEETLLIRDEVRRRDEGSPQCWAARPLVAHNTEFKAQQVRRLEAIRHDETPPRFGDVDHRSDELYRRYCEQPPAEVLVASRAGTRTLIEETRSVSDEDLLDPSRIPWLDGRYLWLQIIVRGFWHPTGHLGEYYLAHGDTDAALSLQTRACALASCLSVPDTARGMAVYNLACAQARAEMTAEAVETLGEALALNRELRANAARDSDLVRLRDDGKLDALLTSR